MASVWSEWRPSLPGSISGAGESHSPRQQAREHTIDTLLKTLSAANWSYDLGDDLIMEGHARVVTADDGAPCLQVGVMRYKAVVVPTCTNLAANTLKLLEDFVAKGGPVFLLPPLPCLIDGQPSDLRAFVNRCRLINSPSELPAHLELLEEAGSLQRVVRTSTSTPWAPIYHLVRRTEKGQFIFLANMGDVPHPEERVRLSGSGPVERWDLSTGAIDRLPACPDGDGICVTLDFAGPSLICSSSIHVTTPHPPRNRTGPRADTCRSSRARRLLSDQWEPAPHPNVMILDYAELRIGES